MSLDTGDFESKELEAESGEDALRKKFPDMQLDGDFDEIRDQLDEKDLPTEVILLDPPAQREVRELAEYIQKGKLIGDYNPQNQQEAEEIVYEVADQLLRILKA